MEDHMTKRELETLYGMLGTIGNVAKYLGFSEESVRKMQLRTPVKVVRDLEDEEFTRYFIQERSAAGMAKRFFVSESFIVAEAERRCLGSNTSGFVGNALTLQEDLKRLGSVAFVAAVWEVTPSEIRRWCKEFGFDPKDHVRVEASGKYTAGLGRQAELAFKEFRGDRIVEDRNLIEGSKANTDFLDSELGRVNVKSSRAYRSKRNKAWLWKLNTEGLGDSDYLAGVLYDAKRENVVGYWLRPVELVDTTKKTITIHERDLALVHKNEGRPGEVGVDMKQNERIHV